MLGRQNRKVRMYIQDGPTLEGVLAGRTFPHRDYILWAPRVVTSDAVEPVVVSGHVEIPRERVLWFQIVG